MNIVLIERSRHCSFSNFNFNLLLAIVAYYFLKYNVNLLMMDDFLFLILYRICIKLRKNCLYLFAILAVRDAGYTKTSVRSRQI